MDKKTRTTIRLNGQSYNALSGQPIGTPRPPINIDGIVKHPTQSHSVSSTKPKSRTITPTKVTVGRKPAPTKTLMRTAVAKPAKTPRKISKVSSTVMGEVVKSSAVTKPPMIGVVDASLARRARTIHKNEKITRFGDPISIDPTPSIPISQPSRIEARQPSTKPSVALSKADPLELAIARATSHEKPKLTKKELKAIHGKKPLRKRATAYALGGALALVIAAYGIYANMPTVMAKVASMRSGIAASLPGYRPAGFTLASVGYKPGIVSFNFNSNIDSRNFSLTESSSSWDSATLASSIVMPQAGTNYKTLSVDGQTIYLYGNDKAAWVSNGILYQVKGNGSLSTQQVIRLATTL